MTVPKSTRLLPRRKSKVARNHDTRLKRSAGKRIPLKNPRAPVTDRAFRNPISVGTDSSDSSSRIAMESFYSQRMTATTMAHKAIEHPRINKRRHALGHLSYPASRLLSSESSTGIREARCSDLAAAPCRGVASGIIVTPNTVRGQSSVSVREFNGSRLQPVAAPAQDQMTLPDVVLSAAILFTRQLRGA